jgi:RND superfamily putative drug exporter
MAGLLYRLGRRCCEHRRLVLAVWLLVLVASGAAAGALKGPTSDAFSVPGTQSQQALDLLAQKFPGTGGAIARIVVAAPPGQTLSEPRYRGLLAPTVALASRVPQTVGASGFPDTVEVSRDGRIAFADLHFAVPVDQVAASTKAALERVAGPARRAGLEVEFSGGVISTGSGEQSGGEVFGLIAAFIVLMVTFGTLSAAGLPLLTAILGVAVGLSAIEALTGVVKLSSTAPTLALMLGLAVGIDYALFIVSRHRQQLAGGMDPQESVARAVATAGSAVVFAGVTVIIALAALTVVGIPFLSVMGLAAAGTIVLAVLIALTLLPAPGHDRGGDRGAGRDRAARAAPDARPAGRGLQPRQRHPAPCLRPAERGLRAGVQRAADRRH